MDDEETKFGNTPIREGNIQNDEIQKEHQIIEIHDDINEEEK